MDIIEKQLDEKLKILPFYTNGKLDTKLLLNYVRTTSFTYDYIFVDESRKKHMTPIRRSLINGLVINKIMNYQSITEKNQYLLTLNHDNIEKILYYDESDIDSVVWITPLYVTKLKTVWKNVEQFRVYDVKKMFHDLLNGLEYMKSKNIASGVIHEDNLAYNGHCWYISGIVNAEKTGEGASGVYTLPCLKSRRHLCYSEYGLSSNYIPEDDLWQLLLMYVITYYGFNPFQEQGTHFLPDNGTLKNNIFRQYDYITRIIEGECQDITLSTTTDCFGRILKNLLTSQYLNDHSYNLCRYIIENNGTPNIENLETLVSLEIRASIPKREEFERLENERLENERLENERLYRERLERQIIETTKTLTDNSSPLSLNVDQYIEKYKHCECVVCFSNTIYYKFSPCNHEICCHSCYTKLNPKKCPMCRQSINTTEKLNIERIEILNTERKNIYVDIKSF